MMKDISTIRNRKSKGKSLLAGALLVVMVLTGCGEAQVDYTVPEDQKLVIYTSHKHEVYEPIIREFEEQTGIWIQVKTGGTKQVLNSINESYYYGDTDIMFGGGIEMLESYQHCFTPYITKETCDLKSTYTSSQGTWTPFTELPIVIIYNPKLVREKEAPKDWTDLFLPQWKGKIAFANPENSGTSYTILSGLAQYYDTDISTFMDHFAEQLDYRTTENSLSVITDVEDGYSLIGITLEETALKHIKEGEDLAIVYPESGVLCVPDGIALVRNAPHEENAKAFIDFCASYPVQNHIVQEAYRRSVRKDVVLPDFFQKTEFIPYNYIKAGTVEGEMLKRWSEILEEASHE